MGCTLRPSRVAGAQLTPAIVAQVLTLPAIWRSALPPDTSAERPTTITNIVLMGMWATLQ
jgi:hypothetical protein